MDQIRIRKGLISDAPAIVRLVESVYRGENSKRGWTTEADMVGGQRTDEEMIRAEMAQPQSLFLVAEKGDALVGSVMLQNKEKYGYLGMLSVDVNAQNLKLGRRLMEACEELVRDEWNHGEIRITVIHLRDELLNWYERRGYRRTGLMTDFHVNRRFGLAKIEGLKFIEMAKSL